MKQLYLIELDTNEKEEITGVLKVIDLNNKNSKNYSIKKIKIICDRTPADTIECSGVTIKLSEEHAQYYMELTAGDE
jgi:hypothetical protein